MHQKKQSVRKPVAHIHATQQKAQSSYFAYAVIIALAFILYGNTISHDYVLDDRMVITHNHFTQMGYQGIVPILSYDSFYGYLGDLKQHLAGGRYRPLSLVTFALEHEWFGDNPHAGHFINILLYIVAALLMFRVLQKLFPSKDQKSRYVSVPFIATVLFIAHPLHTEVVANIKSRDEILALLFSLLALYNTILFLDVKKIQYAVYSGISFFLAMLSKENAAVFLFIIPLTVYFFTNHSLRRNLVSVIPLIIALLINLTIRGAVLTKGELVRELMNNPFLNATFAEHYATVCYTLGYYLKLLVIPHPLTWDYYPYHIPLMHWTDISVLMSLVIYIALGTLVIIGFMKKNIVSYSILFYLLTLFLVSNILFPVGVFMAERFLFTPSFAFVLFIAFALVKVLPKYIAQDKRYTQVVIGIVVGVLVLYAIKTITRNTVWKDNYTITTTDVHVSVNSAMSNCGAADFIIIKASETNDALERTRLIDQAIAYLYKAVDVHPKYGRALAMLADTYNRHKGNTDSSLYFYKRLFAIDSTWQNCAYNIGTMYLDAKTLQPDSSLRYLRCAIAVEPQNYGIYKNYAAAYFYKSDFRKAGEVYEKLLAVYPNDTQLLQDIILTYQNAGDAQKVEYYTRMLQGR